jgi:Tfp pilus assembly protein PilX
MMRSRAGFALAVALACIVIIAALIAAAVFASGQEARATSFQIEDYQAFSYAERAATLAVSSWVCSQCDSLPVGGVSIQNPAANPPLESTVYTTRLDSALFLVVAEGRIVVAGTTRAARRIAIAVGTERDSAGTARAFPLGAHSWSAVYRM